MEKVSFDIHLNLKDKCSEALKKIKTAFEEVKKETTDTTGQFKKFTDLCGKLNMPNIMVWAEAIGKVGDALAGATDKGMSFGQTMADLSSITGLVGKDLAQLEANARKLGKESGLGAENAARAYTILASQIEVADIGMEGLNELQEKSITLAQASGMSLDASAEALAGTVNQFGLGADQAERVINVLAAGSKYGAAEINDLAQSFKVVGSAASAMGLNVEETAGALEILSKANLKGSEAGTSLRNIILKLNTELGIDLGETSLGTALEALKPKLTDATYLSKVFGMENIASAQFLIQNASAVDEMTAQLTGTNTAQEQAAIRTQTTAQRMAELRASIDEAKIGISNLLGGFAPYVAILSENAEMLSMVVVGGKNVLKYMGMLNQAVVKATGSTIAQNVATKAAAAATKIWTTAQAALNAVINGNPIALAVAAIVALGAAVYACYQNCEGFRNVCDAVWNAVTDVASAVWDSLVKAFEKASAVIKEAWKWLKNFFGIEDKASASDVAETINEETQAIENNTTAKKKNLQLNFNTGGKGNKGGTTSGKEAAKEGSLAWLDNAISEKEKAFSLAIDQDSRVRIQKEIDELTEQKRVMEFKVKFADGPKLQDSELGKPRIQLAGAELMPEMGKLKAPTKFLNTYEIALNSARKRQEQFQKTSGAMSEMFSNVGNAIGGAAGQWLQYGANIINTVAQAVPAIASMISIMTTKTATTEADTTANVMNAGSEVMKAHAGIPFVGIAMGVAGIAAIIAAMSSIPKFASGAIAYGPTIGLFGEYAGASNNPEVVAPLNRLKSLLGINFSGSGSKVEFIIEGRVLKGILERENNLRNRS